MADKHRRRPLAQQWSGVFRRTEASGFSILCGPYVNRDASPRRSAILTRDGSESASIFFITRPR